MIVKSIDNIDDYKSSSVLSSSLLLFFWASKYKYYICKLLKFS